MTVVNDDKERPEAESAVSRVLNSARLDARPRVITRGGRSIAEIMELESRDVDLAIIGIRLPQTGSNADDFFERMNELLDHLPTTGLVRSARGFRGEPVLFDAPPVPAQAQPQAPSAPEVPQDEKPAASSADDPE